LSRNSRFCANSGLSRCRTNPAAASQTIAESTAPPGRRLAAGVGTPLLTLSERGTPKPGETVETQTCEIPEQLGEIRALSFEQKLALLRELGPLPLAKH
jgi:hypothetical protein